MKWLRDTNITGIAIQKGNATFQEQSIPHIKSAVKHLFVEIDILIQLFTLTCSEHFIF